MISNEIVNNILHSLDIVDVISRYINVIKKGKNYVAVCPFHNDTNPSLSISKEKQIFKCFVCGKGGNAINFIADYEKVSYHDAIYIAANLAGIKLDEPKNVIEDKFKDLKKIFQDLTEYYTLSLNLNDGAEGKKYCDSRKLNRDICEKFSIGFAPENGTNTIKFLRSAGNSIAKIRELGITNSINDDANDLNRGRLVFAIKNKNNEPVALSSRRIDNSDSPKYINSPESNIFHKSNILYNYYNAKQSAKIDGFIYVVEGFMDVIALYRAGITSVVGLMGTACSKEHIAMLKYLDVEIRMCLDFDGPGQQAISDIISKLEIEKINYRIVKKVDFAKDSDEILTKFGKEKLVEVANTLISKQEFSIDFNISKHDLTTDDGKKELIRSFLPIIENASSSLDIEAYATKLSTVTNYSKDSILSEFKNHIYVKKNVDPVYNQKIPDSALIPGERQNYQLYDGTIKKLENELFYQILKSEKALQFYQTNVEFFYNEIYSKVAIFLINYFNESGNVNTSQLINYIYLNSNEEEANKCQSTITNVLTDGTRHEKLTDTLLVNIKNRLEFEREYYFKEIELDKKMREEIDNVKKFEILYEKQMLKRSKNQKGGH
ncbi:MAG: DNA primase [Bacilli bacterium]